MNSVEPLAASWSATLSRGRYWKGRDPLGRRMSFGEALGDWPMVVVGVVGNVRYSGLETCPTVDIYFPQGLFPQSAITLIARTRTDPLNEAPSVQEHMLRSERCCGQ